MPVIIPRANQRLHVLRETGTAITAPGIQEFLPDTGITTDTFLHGFHVSPDNLTQISDVIHKRNTGSQHRVCRVFSHFRRQYIHKIDRCIIQYKSMV